MRLTVQFYSYFEDLAGCGQADLDLPEGATVDDLLARVRTRFPALAGLERSTLVAVGLEYRERTEVLKDGDEVSLFPPVQGG